MAQESARGNFIELSSQTETFANDRPSISNVADFNRYFEQKQQREKEEALRDQTDAKIFIALAPVVKNLQPQLLNEMLVAARHLKDEWARARALRSVAENCGLENRSDLAKEALDAALLVGEPSVRSGLIIDLLPNLAREERTKALNIAFASANSIRDDKWARAAALARLAPHLPTEVAAEIVGRAIRLSTWFQSSQWGGPGALTRLNLVIEIAIFSHSLDAVYLASELASKTDSKADGTAALIWLAEHLNPELRQKVVRRASIAVRKIEDESVRASVLIDLVPHFGASAREKAIREIFSCAADWSNYIRLLPHISSKRWCAALAHDLFRGYKSQKPEGSLGLKNQLTAYAAVARYLEPHERDEAIDLVLTNIIHLDDPLDRSNLLVRLIALLEPEQRTDSIVEAALVALKNTDSRRDHVLQKLFFESARARAISTLFPFLSSERRGEIFTDAIAKLDQSGDADVLLAITRYLNVAECIRLIDQMHRALQLRSKASSAHRKFDDGAEIIELSSVLAHSEEQTKDSETLAERDPSLNLIEDGSAQIDENLPNEFDIRAASVALVRKARRDWPSERQALAIRNIEYSFSAAEAGLSVEDVFAKAGFDLGAPSEEEVSIPDNQDRELAKFAQNLTKQERDGIWAEALAVTNPPIPKLTARQIEAIQRHAERHSWSERGDDGRTPFEWVRDYYGKWIPGLLQHHLKCDPLLYDAFAKRVSREGLPEGLDVPTKDEAELRAIHDPLERAKVLATRVLNRTRMRQFRSLGL
jgi:hypothetical protein